MSIFNYNNLKALKGILDKEAQFVPMDPAAAGGPPPGDPAAGGGAPPPPMDPSMAGGGMPPGPPMDPAMMDPAMAGGTPPGPPMDPSGLPPPPSAGGESEMSPDGEPYIKMTMTQLIKLVEQIAKLSTKITSPAGAPVQSNAGTAGGTDNAAGMAELNAKLDAVMPLISSMVGGGGVGVG